MPVVVFADIDKKYLEAFFRKIFLVFILTHWTSSAFANIIGVETQNFHPTTNGLDFVTVHSSETLEPGFINMGFFLNYAVNTLPYFDNSATQNRTHFNDSLFSSDINFGLGLLPNLDVGLSIPSVLHQNVKDEQGFRGQFAKSGNTEVRFNSKLRFLGDAEGGIATVLSVNINRLKDNPYVGKDAGPTYNIELVGDTTIDKIALGLNLGYRHRSVGERLTADHPIDPMTHQYIASAAASYLFNSIDTKIIYEIYGSWPSAGVENNTKRAMSSAETLLGLKYTPRTDIALQTGVGTELQNGLSSADWRIYAGINYTLGPTFEKKVELKKIPQALDRLPDEPTEQFVVHDILFEFDSASLVTRGSFESLRKLANHLKEGGAFRLLIVEGHTDSIGTDAYNNDLSKRRAETITKWLSDQYSIARSTMRSVGKGESEPIADNGNYQGRQLNRRVVFKIYR